jgi:nucleoside-diphosphate-sugar epimerase
MDIDPDELLSRPAPELVLELPSVPGDIAVLGAGGKMGPTLARMARRALDEAGDRRAVIAVSRFSKEKERAALDACGVRTVRCDLLDRRKVDALPDAPNVVFMAGMKFGTTGQEELTWATNVLLPAMACERYAASRVVAFSTGNVYGLCPVARGGSREDDPLVPDGEYAMSAVGRERILAHASAARGTRIAILRLNYACELRYGVILDLARKVAAGEEVDLRMGRFNVIWQADASAAALRALAHVASPPLVLNITGPEVLSVREVCGKLGALLGKEPRFRGEESADAILSDARKSHRLFGPPRVAADEIIRRVAAWVLAGGEVLGKPTRFEVRDGRF